MDPAKSADLVLLHLADEVQQILSELQVSEANLTLRNVLVEDLMCSRCDSMTSEVQKSCLNDMIAEVVNSLSVSHQDDHLIFKFLSSLLQPR